MLKTPEMDRIELRDWTQRLARNPNAKRRDIRQLILKAVEQGEDQPGAAVLLGIHPGTLSKWINEHLDGDTRIRVVFRGFTPEPDDDEPFMGFIPAEEFTSSVLVPEAVAV